MCMPQYTLERQDVLNLAITTLAHLPLMARGEQVQVPGLLHVLVFAAASRISVNQACQDLGSAPTGQTVLGKLASQLCDLDQLEETLNKVGPRHIWTRPRCQGLSNGKTRLGNRCSHISDLCVKVALTFGP